MAIKLIKKALETRLSTGIPSISTAYEGTNFSPVTDVPYQRVFLIPRRPDNPTMGDDFYREYGEFQIFLCYPANQGTGSALDRAELIQRHFKRGTVLPESGLNVVIYRTPQIAGTSIIGDRVIVPVLITYYVDVFN